LEENLNHEDGWVIIDAANALWKIQRDNEKALKALLDVMGRVEDTAQGEAFRIVVSLGPKAKRAIPRLVELSRHPDWQVRLNITNALALLAEHLGEAVPLLEALSKDTNRRIRTTAAKALKKIRERKEGNK